MTVGKGMEKTVLPKGFFASGLNCGVRKYRPDIGLISSDFDCTAVAVFTQSSFLGEHIKYDKKLLPSQNIKAIITNSGQANTGVGPVGAQDNLLMAETVASELEVESQQVLTASTGVIGQKMEIEKIVAGISDLVAAQTDSAENFATAVMTTDLVPKCISTEVKLSGGPVRITGVAKGSGMIHPNMATMLGYVLTDAGLDIESAEKLLKTSTDKTFNMISVDGETSTNDTVFLLANGATGVNVETAADFELMQAAVTGISQYLAKAIAKDGEGATKLLEVNLMGAPSHDLAVQWARSITISPLIKTAMHGNDPNWGRLISRLGAEGVPEQAITALDLKIQGESLVANGEIQKFDSEKLVQKLKSDQVDISVDLKVGKFKATAWGCDLSKKYVQINAEYTS